MEVIPKENVEECVCPYCQKAFLIRKEIEDKYGYGYGYGTIKSIRALNLGEASVKRNRVPREPEKTSQKYCRWTQEQDRELLTLRQQGYSWGEIKNTLKRTKSSIYNRFSLLKLGKVGVGEKSTPATYQKSRRKQGEHRSWENKDDEAIIKGFNSNTKPKEIAFRLLRTEHAVRARIKYLRTLGKLGYRYSQTQAQICDILNGKKKINILDEREVSREEEEQINQLIDKGHSLAFIAKALNRPEKTIRDFVRQTRKFCLNCGNPLVGDNAKKFCCDNCRYKYKNKINPAHARIV